jgi:hypothetical protein
VTEQAQARFDGWGIVEMMGHQREIGYVTTENYGAASLFRIDTPELPEREIKLRRQQYVKREEDGQEVMFYAPRGSTVRIAGTPGRSRLIGVGSIYAINPCTEAAAFAALDEMIERPMLLLSLPEEHRPKELEAGVPIKDEALSSSPSEPEAAADEHDSEDDEEFVGDKRSQ